MYFPDRGCVHTLLTLYVYATGRRGGKPERGVIVTSIEGRGYVTGSAAEMTKT